MSAEPQTDVRRDWGVRRLASCPHRFRSRHDAWYWLDLALTGLELAAPRRPLQMVWVAGQCAVFLGDLRLANRLLSAIETHPASEDGQTWRWFAQVWCISRQQDLPFPEPPGGDSLCDALVELWQAGSTSSFALVAKTVSIVEQHRLRLGPIECHAIHFIFSQGLPVKHFAGQADGPVWLARRLEREFKEGRFFAAGRLLIRHRQSPQSELYGRSLNMARQEHYWEALELLEELESGVAAPEDYWSKAARRLRAVVNERWGRVQEAKRHYRWILEQDPDDLLTRTRLARVLIRQYLHSNSGQESSLLHEAEDLLPRNCLAADRCESSALAPQVRSIDAPSAIAARAEQGRYSGANRTVASNPCRLAVRLRSLLGMLRGQASRETQTWSPFTRAFGLFWQGINDWEQGRPNDALVHLQESLQVLQTLKASAVCGPAHSDGIDHVVTH